MVGGLFMIGAIPLTFLSSSPANRNISQTQSVPRNPTSINENDSTNWVAKFESLSKEEKLLKRKAGVEGGNNVLQLQLKTQNMTGSAVMSGENQDVYLITISSLKSYPKAYANGFVQGVLQAFDEQMIKEWIALEFTSIVITDGKRSWTKVLKTGDLIEK
jgi:hypothetical protein